MSCHISFKVRGKLLNPNNSKCLTNEPHV